MNIKEYLFLLIYILLIIQHILIYNIILFYFLCNQKMIANFI